MMPALLRSRPLKVTSDWEPAAFPSWRKQLTEYFGCSLLESARATLRPIGPTHTLEGSQNQLSIVADLATQPLHLVAMSVLQLLNLGLKDQQLVVEVTWELHGSECTGLRRPAPGTHLHAMLAAVEASEALIELLVLDLALSVPAWPGLRRSAHLEVAKEQRARRESTIARFAAEGALRVSIEVAGTRTGAALASGSIILQMIELCFHLGCWCLE